jgi:hypothetical protein
VSKKDKQSWPKVTLRQAVIKSESRERYESGSVNSSMNRLVTVAVLVLLLAGFVGSALITRYRYFDVQGIPLYRIDRWSGMRERWTCPSESPVSTIKPVYVPYAKEPVCHWDANQ